MSRFKINNLPYKLMWADDILLVTGSFGGAKKVRAKVLFGEGDFTTEL